MYNSSDEDSDLSPTITKTLKKHAKFDLKFKGQPFKTIKDKGISDEDLKSNDGSFVRTLNSKLDPIIHQTFTSFYPQHVDIKTNRLKASQ